jgi:hypothetical protein
MRCPSCWSEIAREEAACTQCGKRTFAWLGDPFGLQEPPTPKVGRSATSARPSAETNWSTGLPLGKLLLALLLIGAAQQFLLLALVLPAIIGLVVLWKWPRIDWARFLVLLAVLSLVGLLFVPASRGIIR